MGRVSFTGWRKDNVAHIEIDSCIVNIRTGLSNQDGNQVDVISVIPATEEGWNLDGNVGVVRLVKSS